MLCEKCGKNNANVHFEQNINGIRTSMNLCSECAKKENILYANHQDFFEDDFSFDNIFKGFFGGLSSIAPKVQTKRCDRCLTTFNDILNGARLGCAECYNTFRTEIESVVKKFQPSIRHKGKFPNGTFCRAKKENELERLSDMLKKAINAEEYEEAARIRDEIKKLKGGEGNE